MKYKKCFICEKEIYYKSINHHIQECAKECAKEYNINLNKDELKN